MKYANWGLIGGIHPPEQKQQSTTKPIRYAGLPTHIIIPMLQHIGEEAKPVVAIGDKVLKGQKIGEVRAFVSAPIHASTSGLVVDIGFYPVDHPSALTALCVVIEPDGLDEWTTHIGIRDYRHAEAQTLLAVIREAGIAGMGGAGFPTGSKLNFKESPAVDTIIINAMECEPYITADDMLMRERANEIIEGGNIVRQLLQAQRIIIGIEDNKPQAIQALEVAALNQNHIEILVTPTKYPSGAARQTVYILTGREVPADGRTTDVGVFCLNVGTAAAIYRAIVHGEPLVSRITTVTGLGVTHPANYEVLIGTPVRHLLELANAQFADINRLIVGGPMMGYTLPHADIPVVKTTNCLIAATAKDFPPPAPEMACIRCGDCADVCPVKLLPQQLLWFAKAGEFEKAEKHHLDDCIECGACAYVCPSNIPLVQYYRHAKGAIAELADMADKAARAKSRFERRTQRIEQEEADKEARRKAKAEESATRAEANAEPNKTLIDSKTLTIAAALARSGLKKAEKRLLLAQTNNENTDALQTEITELQHKVAAAEFALQQAPKINF